MIKDTFSKFFKDAATQVNHSVTDICGKLSKISAETLGWMANIALQAATLPFLFALQSGLTNKTPPIDFVLMVWSALVLLFLRSVLLKDTLNILTIGIGFFIQAAMLVLIFFK